MSNTDQAPEPSMEEILSSIRRIISDDNDEASSDSGEAVKVAEPEVETPAVEAATEPEPEVEAQVEVVEEVAPVAEDDDIFELTNVVEIEDSAPEEAPVLDEPDMADFGVEVADSGADIADDIEFVSVETDEPEILELPEPEPESEPEPVMELPIETKVADRLVSDGVGVAAAASFGDLANTLLSRGNNATTVEELVQEMLRPLLKNWLDANLPNLVEKLVSEEIERIARRGR